jgi:hypothetical protein
MSPILRSRIFCKLRRVVRFGQALGRVCEAHAHARRMAHSIDCQCGPFDIDPRRGRKRLELSVSIFFALLGDVLRFPIASNASAGNTKHMRPPALCSYMRDGVIARRLSCRRTEGCRLVCNRDWRGRPPPSPWCRRNPSSARQSSRRCRASWRRRNRRCRHPSAP